MPARGGQKGDAAGGAVHHVGDERQGAMYFHGRAAGERRRVGRGGPVHVLAVGLNIERDRGRNREGVGIEINIVRRSRGSGVEGAAAGGGGPVVGKVRPVAGVADPEIIGGPKVAKAKHSEAKQPDRTHRKHFEIIHFNRKGLIDLKKLRKEQEVIN